MSATCQLINSIRQTNDFFATIEDAHEECTEYDSVFEDIASITWNKASTADSVSPGAPLLFDMHNNSACKSIMKATLTQEGCSIPDRVNTTSSARVVDGNAWPVSPRHNVPVHVVHPLSVALTHQPAQSTSGIHNEANVSQLNGDDTTVFQQAMQETRQLACKRSPARQSAYARKYRAKVMVGVNIMRSLLQVAPQHIRGANTQDSTEQEKARNREYTRRYRERLKHNIQLPRPKIMRTEQEKRRLNKLRYRSKLRFYYQQLRNLLNTPHHERANKLMEVRSKLASGTLQPYATASHCS